MSLTAAATLLVAGCAQQEDLTAMQTIDTTQFQDYFPPEKTPPTASVGDETLLLTSSIWRIDGELHTNENVDESTLPITFLPQPDGALHITLTTARNPMDLYFATFSTLSESGIPTSNAPDSSTQCVADPHSKCHYQLSAEATHITIDSSLLSQGMNVLTAVYPTAESADRAAGINHYSVSWAFRFGAQNAP